MADRKRISHEQTGKLIHSLRGSIKFDTGGKPFAEWMADLNREEKELEEAKFLRMERAGLLRLKGKSKLTG
ncbi:MAG: hypothetical protein WDM80_15380 [Limisphaerales bacterium]